MEKVKPAYIPCFLCGNGVAVKRTIRDKPYFLCDPCGVQVFIRRRKGIRLFKKLVKSLGEEIIRYPRGQGSTFKVLGLVNRLAQLKAKRQEIEDKQGWFETDQGLELAADALENEIQQIEGQLKTLAREK